MEVVKSTNVVWQYSHVARQEREKILGQKGCTIWFTGLPSSGKSTTAFTLENELIKRKYLAYVLDGDNVRHGLNKDLGFSAAEREENIRRVAEVAKLFADAGIITMASFISPYARERHFARKIHSEGNLGFIEVFVDTPIHICESRDSKCLYKRARKGEVKNLTGIDDPYEAPVNCELIIKTQEFSPQDLALTILDFLFKNNYLKQK